MSIPCLGRFAIPTAEDSGQCASREELEEVRSELDSSRGEVDELRRELRAWQNSTITILKKYLIEDTSWLIYPAQTVYGEAA